MSENRQAVSSELSVAELGLVRRALHLPESDWRSKVSRDEQRRLLVTVESRDREIYILQNAVEEIAAVSDVFPFGSRHQDIAQRALDKLKARVEP